MRRTDADTHVQAYQMYTTIIPLLFSIVCTFVSTLILGHRYIVHDLLQILAHPLEAQSRKAKNPVI